MYYNYIKCRAICQATEIRGKPLAKAPNHQLAVFLTICWLCTDFLTRPSACLPACLPVSVSGLIRGEQFESIRAFDRADPSYGRSLAVHSDGGYLGCLPRRP